MRPTELETEERSQIAVRNPLVEKQTNNKRTRIIRNTQSTRVVWRYQREVIRIRKSKKNRQYNGYKIPKGGNQNP